MIRESEIRKLVEEELEDTPIFIVELSVNASNFIKVLIDGDEGAPIKECVKVSRLIENSLDREVTDFELQVSSPGADQPLKVWRQYAKHVGRDVKVKTTSGEKVQGKLILAENQGVEVLHREKRRIEGRKSKAWFEEIHKFRLEDIEETKVIIGFK